MLDKRQSVARLVGTRLRAWRKEENLKAFHLASLIGISQGSLSDLENNKSLPSAETIARLHLKTNINILWLLTGKPPTRKSSLSVGSGHSLVAESSDVYGDDKTLKNLVDKLVRIYQQGNKEKIAHLTGFLTGADPS